MTTIPLTRQAIDAAEPLSFDRKPKQELTIAITCVVNGFTTEITFSGQLEQLDAITKRLQALGAEPVSAAKPAAAPASQGKSTKVQPEYNADGEPCCTKHHKPLREGKYGLYCPAKDDSTERGYCSIKFAD